MRRSVFGRLFCRASRHAVEEKGAIRLAALAWEEGTLVLCHAVWLVEVRAGRVMQRGVWYARAKEVKRRREGGCILRGEVSDADSEKVAIQCESLCSNVVTSR